MADLKDNRHPDGTAGVNESPTLSGDELSNNEKANHASHFEGKEETGGAAISYTDGIDPAKERKLLRKIDLYVIPWVCLLYLSSFLDRVNIGNARLYSLEDDLGMSGNQYQIAVSVLFPTYVLFELPSNLVLKHYVRPSRWIAFITTAWGLIATLSGLTQSYAGLLACRVLLGLFEAGLFPGCVVYLTFFYTRKEIALRTAYLFVAAALAGAFGGLLAFAIGFMDGLQGLSGWRWIFIVEGIPTIILGVASWWYMADDAHNAYFLNEEERALVVARRRAQLGTSETFEWADARKGLKDWKTYTFAFCQFCNCCMLYSYNTFLPTIIFEIMPDAGRAVTQLLTIPCYACGATAYLAGAWFSDRVQIRGATTACFGAASVVGYIVLISPVPSGVLYFGTCMVGLGIYAALGLPIAWLNSNNPRYGKRTAASGTHISLGNTAGIVAPFLYPDSDAPYYRPGHGINMALVAAAACTYTFVFFWLTWENKQRREGKRDHRIEGKTEEEIEAMGDENPRYMYSR